MAVAEMTNSTLQLVFTESIDPESGSPTFKYKSFNSVKTDATADQLYAIATAVTELQQLPLYSINRKDTSDIREQ